MHGREVGDYVQTREGPRDLKDKVWLITRVNDMSNICDINYYDGLTGRRNQLSVERHNVTPVQVIKGMRVVLKKGGQIDTVHMVRGRYFYCKNDDTTITLENIDAIETFRDFSERQSRPMRGDSGLRGSASYERDQRAKQAHYDNLMRTPASSMSLNDWSGLTSDNHLGETLTKTEEPEDKPLKLINKKEKKSSVSIKILKDEQKLTI